MVKESIMAHKMKFIFLIIGIFIAGGESVYSEPATLEIAGNSGTITLGAGSARDALDRARRIFRPMRDVTVAGTAGQHRVSSVRLRDIMRRFEALLYEQEYTDLALDRQRARYANDLAGLTHLDKAKYTFSGYRFHDEDPVFFQNGLRLTCRCGEELAGKKMHDPPETEYTTYTWVYQW